MSLRTIVSAETRETSSASVRLGRGTKRNGARRAVIVLLARSHNLGFLRAMARVGAVRVRSVVEVNDGAGGALQLVREETSGAAVAGAVAVGQRG